MAGLSILLHLLPQEDVLGLPLLIAKPSYLVAYELDRLAQHRLRAHGRRIGRGGEPKVLLQERLARANHGVVERDVAVAVNLADELGIDAARMSLYAGGSILCAEGRLIQHWKP